MYVGRWHQEVGSLSVASGSGVSGTDWIAVEVLRVGLLVASCCCDNTPSPRQLMEKFVWAYGSRELKSVTAQEQAAGMLTGAEARGSCLEPRA